MLLLHVLEARISLHVQKHLFYGRVIVPTRVQGVVV